MHPRKGPYLHLELKVGAENRSEAVDLLEKDGIEASNRGRNGITMRLNMTDIQQHRAAIGKAIQTAEQFSHR